MLDKLKNSCHKGKIIYYLNGTERSKCGNFLLLSSWLKIVLFKLKLPYIGILAISLFKFL